MIKIKWPWTKSEVVNDKQKEPGMINPNPPVEKELQQQEALYNQLQNEEIEKGLEQSARNLNERFNGNWFTLMQVIKKTNVKSALDARQMMNMLELKGLCIKMVHIREEKYKITISKERQIANLDEQLKRLNHQMERIQKMRDALK